MSYEANLMCEDPTNKVYLKICFVCKDVAKPGREHLRNYGGVVCYSCRAFWRRSHQQSRQPNFSCKKTNQCIVSVETRRRCQKCRYDRCLLAGMNPEAVLNTDQKKVRFRKLLKKQQKLLSLAMKRKAALPLTLKYSKTLLSLREKQKPDPTRFRHVDNSKPKGEIFRLENFCHQMEDSALDLTMPKKNQLPSLNVDIITNYFIGVMTQISCPKTVYLIQKLTTLQSGFFEMLSLSKSDIKFLQDKLALAFRLFAYNFSSFCNMNPLDQQKLLAENTPLFIQLYMGQFLLVSPRHIPTSSDDQLSRNVLTNDFNQRLFLERFNVVTDLFLPGANLIAYSQCISKLRGLPEISNFKQKAVLAFAVLFFSDAIKGRHVECMYETYVRSCENCISLSNLASNLTEMATLSSRIIAW